MNQSDINILTSLIEPFVRKPYRFYHGMDHIKHIIKLVKDNIDPVTNPEQFDLGILFAVFHDAVYEPWRNDNEDKSIELMHQIIPNKYISYLPKLERLIELTKYKFDHYGFPEVEPWAMIYLYFDVHGLFNNDPSYDITVDEINVFKEYQFYDWKDYQEGRIKVLTAFKKKFGSMPSNIERRISFLKNFKPRIGVFAGSFNPFHVGHRNILEKAEKMFDKVIIANGYDPEKAATGSVEEIKKWVGYRQVESYSGLLTDYLKKKSYPITVIRGLRNGNDLAHEQNLANVLRDVQKKPLDIVYIICDREYEYVSSGAVRILNKLGVTDLYV